ncbi:glycosyl hydrolase [Bradyrhizobium sp. ORS 375]|uniref:glycoside hydrolase family 26 protein n=1 Tax=Bradyrhizobium sp. (strain ORS 375) TaxID=566679 RepID=UPI0002E9C5E1|nr:glycosyl hydrolase [Bradyrhizobium sp. ORS 375]
MAAPSAEATEFGAYVGAGCDGAKRLPGFEQFAGRKVERTVDALDQRTWADLESSIDWVIGCWDGVPVKLTLSVPMLTRDRSATLAEGAAGKYDETFRRVARTLVAHGRDDATIRIGWEFNGDWQPWSAAKDPAAFVTYFRRIVGLMRETPSQRFSFEWCPNHGRHQMDPTEAYPGDDVVDVIGMDVYDESWTPLDRDPTSRWTKYVYQPFGLEWQKTFAAQHRKQIAFSEWGTGRNPHGTGGADNPVFIRGMASWFAANKPLYQSYWDNPSPEFNTMLSNGQFPRAAAEFVKQFGPDAAARP